MQNTSSLPASPVGVNVQYPQLVLEGKRTGYYITFTLFILTLWLILPKKQRSQLEVPFYKASKKNWIFDAETLIKDSYTKFRDRVYQIKATEGVQVLVPASLVGELKGLPEDVLSATEAVSDALQSKYTKFSPGHNGETLALLIRTKLTQNLTRVVPRLREELEYILATEFPACEDWTPVKWQPFSLRAITRLSGRAFVGPSLNRDEKWMDTTINFAVHVFTACVKLQFIPEWARPVGQYFVSELRQIRKDIKIAKELLEPILKERLQNMELSNGEDAPDDMIQWLLEALPKDEKSDLTTQAELQLIIAAASIHTTNNLLCECLCDLAAYPEVQEELRQEAYQILEAENGWERKESLAKLKKLDSFMREVQRLSGNISESLLSST
ncbi:hypothetical protein SNK03_002147 [Fusarium graminearum]